MTECTEELRGLYCEPEELKALQQWLDRVGERFHCEVEGSCLKLWFFGKTNEAK